MESDPIDWNLTTPEGSLREQLRRWSELPLERIVLAQEEMQDLAEQFGAAAKTRGATQSQFPSERRNKHNSA